MAEILQGREGVGGGGGAGPVGFLPKYRGMQIFMSLLVIRNFDIGIFTSRVIFHQNI